ncbi:hypothetical protein OG500_14880 [Kitasatospora sp. NBC_01250]|uniref:hypothetical protein n=1 Tax=unclassified Kitasatospora TaxID=2633591 RepID=UPI002E0FAA99|nr:MULTISPECIES: hypothetical protein [unclassified Kitasatospora]WSJ67468.1 hypothetical protein OG294_15880 [Kitasatospora sp. NBC_01302]
MRARHFAATGLLALAVGLGCAGTAAANPVIIEPDPVTPGSQFAVFDGGNCDGAGGQAVFRSREQGGSDGQDIPAVKLGSLRGLTGAMATVPEHARPGVYDVTIKCTTVTKSQVTTTFTVHDSSAKPGQSGSGPGAGSAAPGSSAQSDRPGHEDQSGSSGHYGQPGETGPKGTSHAGLGGSTGPNTPETLAGVTLLATAGAATFQQYRRRRSS